MAIKKTDKFERIEDKDERKKALSIALEKIEKVVTEHHNATVQWTYDAAAEEYRESLAQ